VPKEMKACSVMVCVDSVYTLRLTIIAITALWTPGDLRDPGSTAVLLFFKTYRSQSIQCSGIRDHMAIRLKHLPDNTEFQDLTGPHNHPGDHRSAMSPSSSSATFQVSHEP
jgi:hypothetical protein